MDRVSRHRRRIAAGQKGFTVVELVVASAVIMTVLLSMAYVMTGSLISAGCSRQRNTADALVNKVLEQVRALPYTSVDSGSSTGDTTFTGDTANITNSGGTYTYTGTSETMPNTSGVLPAPLDPHQRSTTVNSTTYTVDTYVTNYSAISGAYRVTAVASWSGGSCQGITRSVSAQTIVQQPSANTTPCLSDGTHPFPAPCVAAFYSTLNTGSGVISISTPNGYGGNAIAGIPLTLAQLSLPTANCTLQIEQVATGGCSATGSSETLNVNGSTQTSGGTSASCSDSSDPSSSALTCGAPTGTLSQAAMSTLTSTGGGNTLSLVPGVTGDSGSLVDTTAASSSPSCTDLAGTQQSNGKPCDHASVTQASLLTATASLAGGGVSMGTATLASVAADNYAKQLFDSQVTASGGTYCASTSGDGCIHSGTKRGYGASVGIGGIPTTIKNDKFGSGGTFGCDGYALELVNYGDSSTAESGVSVSAPSASQVSSSGGGSAQLKYATATGGCSPVQNITWGATAPTTITFPTVNFTDAVFSGGSTTVTITPTLTIGTATATRTTSACGSNTCTTASTSTVQSPVRGDLVYTITTGGVTVCDMDIHMDLGTLFNQTSYTAAPSAS